MLTFVILTVSVMTTSQVCEKPGIPENPKVFVTTPTPTPAPLRKIVNFYGYIRADILNKRMAPDQNSDIFGVLYRGDKVNVIEIMEPENGRWYKLSDETYVDKQYIVKEEDKLTSRGIEVLSNRISHISNLNADNLKYIIRNTRFKRMTEAILYFEKEQKVNAFFTVAVAKHESADGYSHLSYDRNNLFGYNAFGDVEVNAKEYKSMNESIYDFTKLIRKYLNRGIGPDIYEIGKYYCESPDWAPQVEAIMSEDLNSLRNLR